MRFEVFTTINWGFWVAVVGGRTSQPLKRKVVHSFTSGMNNPDIQRYKPSQTLCLSALSIMHKAVTKLLHKITQQNLNT